MHIEQIEELQTCCACPELYDFVVDGTVIGYLRLRHGTMRVATEPGDQTLFSRTFPLGPDVNLEPEEVGLPVHHSDGVFEGDQVRTAYLALAKRKLAEHHVGM